MIADRMHASFRRRRLETRPSHSRRTAVRPRVEFLEERELLASMPVQAWNLPADYGVASELITAPDGVWYGASAATHVEDGTTILDRPASLVRIAPDGTLRRFDLPADVALGRLAAAPDGKIWYTGGIRDAQPPSNFLAYVDPSQGVSTRVTVPYAVGSTITVSGDGLVWTNGADAQSHAGVVVYSPASQQASFISTDPYNMVAMSATDGAVQGIAKGPYNGWNNVYLAVINRADQTLSTGEAPALVNDKTAYKLHRGPDGSAWTPDVDAPGVFLLGGTSGSYLNLGGAWLQDVAGGGDGHVYCADYYGAWIYAADPAKPHPGSDFVAVDGLLQLPIPGVGLADGWVNGSPIAIASGPDGNIWYVANTLKEQPGTAALTAYPTYGRITVEHATVTVGADAQAPLKPGELVHYTLDATGGPDHADKLSILDVIPGGLTVVAASVITDGTVVRDGSDGNVEVEANRDRLHLEFDARVASLDDLPLGVEALVTRARATAHFADGRTVYGRTDYPVPLAQVNQLQVTIEALTPTPGVVRSGETIEYKVSTRGAPGAQHVEVMLAAPPGTTLYYNGQKVDNISLGSDSSYVDNSPNLFGPRKITAVVDDAASLPPDLTAIVATAHGSTRTALGLTYTKDAGSRLYLTGTLAVQVVPSVTKVRPGGEIEYTITARPLGPADSFRFTDVIPPGTSLVPGSITNGGVLGTDDHGAPQITWDLPGGTVASVGFRVKVGDADQLPAQLTAIHDVARAEAVAGGATTYESASADVTIVRQSAVVGSVRDVTYAYPNRLNIPLTFPLAGQSLTLLDASGRVVANGLSAGDGTFRLPSIDPGDYKLRVVGQADFYDAQPNGISRRDAFQAVPVHVEDRPGESDPKVDLGPVYLPLSVFNTAAALLMAMHNIDMPVFSDFQSVKRLFTFETTGLEANLRAYAGTPEKPGPQFDPHALFANGPADPWVAAIRAFAAVDVLYRRYTDCMNLVDSAGKAIALLVATEACAKIGTQLGNIQGLSTEQLAQQKLLLRNRAGGFVVGIGAALPILLDQYGLTGSNKNFTQSAIAASIRYGLDIYMAIGTRTTAGGIPDLAFEVIFNATRTAVTCSLLRLLTGISFNTDAPFPYNLVTGPLNSLEPLFHGDMAFRTGILDATVRTSLDDGGRLIVPYRTGTDTVDVLTRLDALNDAQAALARRYAVAATTFAGMTNIVRALSGIYGLNIAYTKAGGVLTGKSAKIQAVLAKWSDGLKAGTKLNDKRLIAAGLVGVVATSVGGMVHQLAYLKSISDTAYEVPQAKVPAATALATLGVAAPAGPAGRAVVTAAAAPTHREPQEYLGVLDAVARAVKAGNARSFPGLLKSLTKADSALFASYLIKLSGHAAAAMPRLAAASRNSVVDLASAVDAANRQSILLYAQLGLWARDPKGTSKALVLKQLAEAKAAVSEAAAAAKPVDAATYRVKAPARLAIDRVFGDPKPLRPGTPTILKFQVTNLGDYGSSAVDVTIVPNPGLRVLGPATRKVPALAAGRSVSVAWKVVADTPPGGTGTATFQVATGSGTGPQAELDDVVFVK